MLKTSKQKVCLQFSLFKNKSQGIIEWGCLSCYDISTTWLQKLIFCLQQNKVQKRHQAWRKWFGGEWASEESWDQPSQLRGRRPGWQHLQWALWSLHWYWLGRVQRGRAQYPWGCFSHPLHTPWPTHMHWTWPKPRHPHNCSWQWHKPTWPSLWPWHCTGTWPKYPWSWIWRSHIVASTHIIRISLLWTAQWQHYILKNHSKVFLFLFGTHKMWSKLETCTWR